MNENHRFWDKIRSILPNATSLIQQGELEKTLCLFGNFWESNDLDVCTKISSKNKNHVVEFIGNSRRDREKVKLLLENNPNVPGWDFYDNIQRTSLMIAIDEIKIKYDLDVAEARFNLQNKNKKYSIVLFLDNLEELKGIRAKRLGWDFLYLLLGECLARKHIEKLSISTSSSLNANTISAKDLVDHFFNA